MIISDRIGGGARVDIMDRTVAMRFGSYKIFSEEGKIFYTFTCLEVKIDSKMVKI